MGSTNSWEFGWAPLLTIVGMALTTAIAFGTYQTFRRVRRDKVEDKRIELAIDTLAIFHESKFVFEGIRSPLSYEFEWADMPSRPNEDENARRSRGPFYATLKRIEGNRDFFDRVWRTQVRCTAVFGQQCEEMFLKLHQARRRIEVSAATLARDPQARTSNNEELWERMRGDVWDGLNEAGQDQVANLLKTALSDAEELCRPVVEQGYGDRWPSLLAIFRSK